MPEVKLQQLTQPSQASHEIVITWTFARGSDTDHFIIDEEYCLTIASDGTKKWIGSTTTVTPEQASVSGGTYRQTWSVSDSALMARVRVKPIAKEKTVNKKKKPIYSGSWCGYKKIDFRTNSLPAPSVSVSYNDTTRNATVTVTAGDSDVREYRIKVQCGGDVKYSDLLKSSSGSVTKAYKITPGETWAFKAKTYSHNHKADSPWSTTSYETAKPSAPTIKDGSCKAYGEHGITVKWDTVTGASTYTAEYTYDSAAYFKSNRDAVSSVTGIEGSTFVKEGLDGSHRDWFIRVQAVNSAGEGEWSDVATTMLACKPDPPTTYDTNPSYMLSEDIRFRWTHNSEDISEQTSAQLRIMPSTSEDTGVMTAERYAYDSSNGESAFILPTALSSHGDITSIVGDGITYTYSATSKYRYALGWDSDSGLLDEIYLIRKDKAAVEELVVTYETHDYDTITINNGNEYYVLAASSRSSVLDNVTFSDGDTIKWDVRTKGAHSDWSDWSVARQLSVYADASLSCSLSQSGGSVDEGNPLTSLPLTVSLDANGGGSVVSGYHVAVIAAESVVVSSFDGSETAIPAGAVVYQNDYATSNEPYSVQLGIEAGLPNTSSLKVVAEVVMQSGLRAVAESSPFDVDFASDVPTPDCMVAFDDEELTATVRVACYTESNGAKTNTLASGVTLAVYRIEPDGSLTHLASGLPNNGSVQVVDPHASFGTCYYRAVATSTSTGMCSYDDGEDGSYHATCCVQWDEEWSEFAEDDEDSNGITVVFSYVGNRIDGLYNLNLEESGDVQSEDVEYIGRKHPVSYYGTQERHQASYKVDFPKSDEDALTLCRKLRKYPGDVYVREPSGLGFWARVSNPQLSLPYDSQARSFSFTAIHVDHPEEAVG